MFEQGSWKTESNPRTYALKQKIYLVGNYLKAVFWAHLIYDCI